MKILFIVLLLALLGACSYKSSSKTCSCSRCATCHCKKPDYYWQMYNGKVPYDAVEVDDESTDELNIYIGIGHIEDENGERVVPGALYRGTSFLKVVDLHGFQTLCDNVMILCSKKKRKLLWKQVNITDVLSLSNSYVLKLVSGGFENGSKLFIGRIYYEDNLNVGVVYPQTDQHEGGFHFVMNDQTYVDEEVFEILYYI